MNPETITTLSIKYFSKGKFFLIPLRENDKPIIIHLSGKNFKMFEHMNGKEKSFSIGIDLSEENVSDEDNFGFIQEKEAKIQNLAMENLPEIKKIQPKFNFKKDDFHIIKKIDLAKTKFMQKFLSKTTKSSPLFGKHSS